MNRRIAITASLTLATAAFAVSATPAFGDSTGSVAMNGPNFTGTTKTLQGASQYTNCSSASESIYAKGTDAQSATSAAMWTLDQPSGSGWPCDAGPNRYGLWIRTTNATFSRVLLTTDVLLESAGAGANSTLDLSVTPPCSGSSGAGEKMDFQYILTATF